MNFIITIQISHVNRTLFQCSQPTELQQVVEKIEKRVRQLGYRHCSFIIKYCQHGGRCCHVAAADVADVADDSIPAAGDACNLMAENRKCENY